MTETQTAIALLERFQRRSFLIGVIVLGLSFILAFLSPAQFFRSYLFAYVFWIGLALGSLAITLLHHLSGGRWGAAVRRLLESGTRTFPLLALLFLPLIPGITSIYVWTDQTKSCSRCDPAAQKSLPQCALLFRTHRSLFRCMAHSCLFTK